MSARFSIPHTLTTYQIHNKRLINLDSTANMQLSILLLPTVTFLGTILGGLIPSTSASTTDAAPSLIVPSPNTNDTLTSPSGEEASIEWVANSNPPAWICTPYTVSYRDDNYYPQMADCQHIYDQYVDFSNTFCLGEPSGALDFGTLVTYVSLVDNKFSW